MLTRPIRAYKLEALIYINSNSINLRKEKINKQAMRHTDGDEVGRSFVPVYAEPTEIPNGQFHLDTLYDEVVYPVLVVAFNVELGLLAQLYVGVCRP